MLRPFAARAIMAPNSIARAASAPIRQMLTALSEGYNVALTADVPKVSRIAGPGIIRLARDSGRPIYPVALASSRRKELNNWDRSAVNLPFSLIAGVAGDPVRVGPMQRKPISKRRAWRSRTNSTP